MRKSVIARLDLEGEDDKIALANEHLEAQGWPVYTTSEDQKDSILPMLATFSDFEKKSFAGNGMQTKVIGIMIIFALGCAKLRVSDASAASTSQQQGSSGSPQDAEISLGSASQYDRGELEHDF